MNICSFVFCLFVILVFSRCGFKGWIQVLIASVPDLCIRFTFSHVLALAPSNTVNASTLSLNKIAVEWNIISRN